jgi:hypothetical protein
VVPFAEPFDPTDDELVAWANDPGARPPVADWDVIIEGPERAPLLLHLACDLTRPQRHACLHILYVHVGQAAIEGWPARRVDPLRVLLASVPDDAPADVQRWRQQSLELLEGQRSFDADAWTALGPSSRSARDRELAAIAAGYLRRRVTFGEAAWRLSDTSLPEALWRAAQHLSLLHEDVESDVLTVRAIDDKREELRTIAEVVVRRFAD